ncbi:MAG: hypothetical protein J6X89_07575 [Bacteroidales bacterium]|nr:hypothetical protein [Bacteroidales bacterium]
MSSYMKRLFSLIIAALIEFPLPAQSLEGKWLVYEGGDGSELIVEISQVGSGKAELSLTRRHEAVSYGEGSQFWGTFRSTGGYYFLVNGNKSVDIRLTLTDSTFVVAPQGSPSLTVKAWLDEAYSTRELSDYGDYKKQVLAQWKKDFPKNDDVKKYKWMMEHYFIDFYDDVFDVLLYGTYQIVERTDSTIVLKNPNPEMPDIMWKKNM